MIRSEDAHVPVRVERARTDRSAVTLAQVAALVAILTLAIGIRFVGLTTIGFNSDEAVYAGQGAAIAGIPELSEIFPVFRAHPMLFQFVVALVFSAGPDDWAARATAASVGVLTVLVTFLVGRRMWGTPGGLYAGLFLAVMPYHVVVTRQVLLDGPMVLCATVSLYFMTRYAQSQRPEALYAASAAMGLTFLAKETGFIMIGAIYAFLALSPQIRLRFRDLVLSLGSALVVMAPFPLAVTLAGGGGGEKTQQYLVWQLFRRPNHTWEFYASVVPEAVGYALLALAVLGLLSSGSRTWRELLLVLWVLVPVCFFQLWPTKGFQYLLPAAPALALLGARALVQIPTATWIPWRIRSASFVPILVAFLVSGMLAQSTWARVHPGPTVSFLAGSGGVAGGREAGLWIRDNVPKGATFLTIGPSMANIVKWYGRQDAYGLSVSPNPLHRNPSYEAVTNPDYQLRIGEIQYVVWDSYSAGRSEFFSEGILHYARKYNGRAVHTETVAVATATGQLVEKPVIIVYEVHP